MGIYLPKKMKGNEYTVPLAQKALIRAFIKKENLIYRDDNVFNMNKAFVVNSVLGWFLEQRTKKLISLTDMQYYVRLLQEYIDDKIDLSWDGQQLQIHIKK